MPKFKLTDHQTGKTVVVSGDSAPSEAEVEQIFKDAGLYEQVAATEHAAGKGGPGFVATAADMVRSVPGGIAKGVSALAGLPGDIDAGLTSAADWAMKKVDPATLQKMQAARESGGLVPKPPTSGKVLDALSSPFGGLYKPKTTAGEYAETVASFAPNALAPGSAVNRIGRVVLPGVLSEDAGQATKGTKWEPLARTAGALVGGIGQGIAEGVGASRANPVPTTSDLKSAADGIYRSAKNAGVGISPQAYDTLVGDIGSAVKTAGTHPKLHPKVAGALESLEEAKTGQPIALDELERLRRIANGAAKSIEPDERRVAGVIIDKIDDFMDNLSPTQTTSGNPAAAATLSDARGIWAKMRKSETITDAIERADNMALTQNGNRAAALRSQFQALAKNKKAMRGFSASERDAIKNVARVGALTGPLSAVGALRPRGLVALGELGAGAVHPEATMPALGLAAAGQGSQWAANALTSRNAKTVAEQMRRGTPNPTATAVPRNLILSALLSKGAH
jgi:hypothetical protein